MDDTIVMNLVLDLHSEIGSNFGIIVSYSDEDFLKELLEEDKNLYEFLAPIYLDMKPANLTERIILLPKVPELYRKTNRFVKSSDIHPNLRSFVDKLPIVKTSAQTKKIITPKLIEESKQKREEGEVKKQNIQSNEFARLEEASKSEAFKFAKRGLTDLFSDNTK